MSARHTFGATWWGRAWVRALEGRARLDPNRLPRGRTYARQSRVDALTVGPGEVTALVQGRQRRPYRVRLRVRTFTVDEWASVIDAIASRAGHAAALFDGELPPGVLDDAAGAGVELLPGPGELVPSCSCPDWADPCKHAAAVCYLVAEALDDDPFELFHLRGLTRDQVLAQVRARRQATDRAGSAASIGRAGASTATDADGGGDRGVVARDAFARPPVEAADLWALDVPDPAERAGSPPPLPVAPPVSSGVRLDELTALAADAARRAWMMTLGVGDSGLGLTEDEDLARLGARALGTPAFAVLAARSGAAPRRLAALAIAWDAGDREGVAVTEQTWQPPAEWIEEGRQALAGEHPSQSTSIGWTTSVRDNRVSGRGIQLRVGESGLWYRFAKVGKEWQIDGRPSPDPVELVEEM